MAWTDLPGRRAGRFGVPAVRRRLGPFRAAYDAGDRARSGARDGRRQADDQRAGELHARRQFHPRRGARMREHVSSAPASTPSASRPAAAPAGCWRNGWSTARRRSICGSSISAASPACTATGNGSATARSKPMASTTRSASRMRNIVSGRPRIVSPLYERLKAHRAVFGSKLGWERPNWFAPEGIEPKDIYSMGRQNWFDAGRRGAPRSARARRHLRPVVLRQIRADGRGCADGADWICANDVDEAGRAGSPIRRCSTRAAASNAT